MLAKLTPVARKLRREETPAEKALWRSLRRKQVGRLKFRRQHLVHGRIADFACPLAKLIVELDGAVHDDEDAQLSDERRTRALEAAGWRVVRFKNLDVMDGLAGVVEEILDVAQSRLTP